MVLSVAVISVISVAGGIILIAASLTIVFKLCWVKKRRSRRLNSSLRKEEKVQRISGQSFTRTVTDEPYTVSQKELTPYATATTTTHIPHSIAQRYSEPILTGHSRKNVRDLSRPHSETDVQYGAFHANIKTLRKSDPIKAVTLRSCGRTNTNLPFDGEINSNCTRTIETKNTQHQQNIIQHRSYTDSDKDMPAWSMDSIEYQPTDNSNTDTMNDMATWL